MNRKERLLAFFKDKSYTPLLYSELLTVLGVPKKDENEFSCLLKELIDEGYIIKTKRKRYVLSQNPNFVSGIFRGSSVGYGFVSVEDADDIFIGKNYTNGAFSGDKVTVSIFKKSKNGKLSEGRIEKIIERGKAEFVGRFEKSRNFGFVVLDEKRIPKDVFISKNHFKNAKTGDKVVVEITNWGENTKKPEGKVIEVLGNENDIGMDVVSVIRRYNLKEEFSKEVLSFADGFEDEIKNDEIYTREDLRDELIITIDGDDAKDLDDAISLKKENDGYVLGVHIADVSHYVTEKSPLDKEAFKRGTSVYLADRVIPMLPKKLSNGICSLNPNKDRLTLSVIMKLDLDGNLVSHKIVESVVNSKERMTYNNVYKILEGDKNLQKEYAHILDMLRNMYELSKILRKKRMDAGAVDFDLPEAKVEFFENGKVKNVYKYETTYANHIIEEFMLLCNKTVAEQMFWMKIPFIYRVHEPPSNEKVTAFCDFIKSMGYSIKNTSKPHPSQYSKLLEKIKETPYEKIIGTVMLRSLMKAQYVPENKGHFGLAFDYYCHFTSPIRRYPDLAIHRIIKEYLNFGIDEKRAEQLEYFVHKASVNSSETEINAQDAERDVLDIKKCEYMSDKIGNVYDAYISSVTSFGFFAELENTIEGLVRVVDLKDDYYIYDDKNYRLIGERTNNAYKIGDKVKVRVKNVNISLCEIDFELEE
ncbi:MAG: ribonuclease R [Ruminococcaceae bacterium]|nr:ribonuclease R [Oscillospiraceae bacterium]